MPAAGAAGAPTIERSGAGGGRFIALDSLRGLVALAIVFFHMGDFGWIAGLAPFRSGWMLVEFFFVLSGFLITSLLLTEWDRDQTFSLRSFYRRRAFRLLPALVVMLAVVSVAAALTAEDILKHCRAQLTGYKLPKHVEFRTELPKTPVGKVLRRELRDAPKAKAAA